MRWTRSIGAPLPFRAAVRNRWRLASLALAALLVAGCSCLWPPTPTPPPQNGTLVQPGAPTEPFLGPADFQGGYVPRPGPTLNGLQSTYDGTVAITMVQRAIVQQMLAPGLALAQPKLLPGGTVPDAHPVLHLIGDQRDASVLGTGYPFWVGPGYREMIWIVPFVVRGNGTQWHNYVVRMYLDDHLAVAGGNLAYGYAKEFARLDRTQPATAVRHTVATPDLATTWFIDEIDVATQWLPAPNAAASLPRWNDLRAILEMPVLGLVQPGPLPASPLPVCSYWEFDYANAELAATVSRHRVVTRFVSGMAAWETLGALQSAPDGAVAMRNVRWRLAFPPQGC